MSPEQMAQAIIELQRAGAQTTATLRRIKTECAECAKGGLSCPEHIQTAVALREIMAHIGRALFLVRGD